MGGRTHAGAVDARLIRSARAAAGVVCCMPKEIALDCSACKVTSS